jgi:hypothetical protein
VFPVTLFTIGPVAHGTSAVVNATVSNRNLKSASLGRLEESESSAGVEVHFFNLVWLPLANLARLLVELATLLTIGKRLLSSRDSLLLGGNDGFGYHTCRDNLFVCME